MAWRVTKAKRLKRGQSVVGARLVFDNGLPENHDDFRSEQFEWGRVKGQDTSAFKAMIQRERTNLLNHFNRRGAVVEVDL